MLKNFPYDATGVGKSSLNLKLEAAQSSCGIKVPEARGIKRTKLKTLRVQHFRESYLRCYMLSAVLLYNNCTGAREPEGLKFMLKRSSDRITNADDL